MIVDWIDPRCESEWMDWLSDEHQNTIQSFRSMQNSFSLPDLVEVPHATGVFWQKDTRLVPRGGLRSVSLSQQDAVLLPSSHTEPPPAKSLPPHGHLVVCRESTGSQCPIQKAARFPNEAIIPPPDLGKHPGIHLYEQCNVSAGYLANLLCLGVIELQDWISRKWFVDF